MLNKKDLCRINIIFKNIRESDLWFGGVHVLLAGDFFQLPPTTGCYPLYIDIDKYKNPSIIGYKIWHQFTTVVILTINHRQMADIEWADGCKLARKGVWTDKFINIINSRLIPDMSLSHLFDIEITQPSIIHVDTLLSSFAHYKYIPIVTQSNNRRNIIINEFTHICANNMPYGDLPIRIVNEFKLGYHGNTKCQQKRKNSTRHNRQIIWIIVR